MTVVIPSDCQINPARGGQDGAPAAQFEIGADGAERKLPNLVRRDLMPGEWIRGRDAGGGYDDLAGATRRACAWTWPAAGKPRPAPARRTSLP